MTASHDRNIDFALLLSPHGSAVAEGGRDWQADSGNAIYRSNPLIAKLQGYCALAEDDRAVLAGLTGSPRAIEPGTDLCRESDTADGVLIVTSGFACRYKLRPNGARQITDYLLPGDHCELKALPGEMRGSIAALAPSKVAKVSSDALSSVQREYPAIAEAFRRSALVEGAVLREWLMNMGRRSADERLAHLFCELFTRMRAVGLVHANSFRLPLTQFDLGDTMGLSYVHVNRTLQSLRQQGLFTLSSKTLTILNPEGLQKLAGFDPSYLR